MIFNKKKKRKKNAKIFSSLQTLLTTQKNKTNLIINMKHVSMLKYYAILKKFKKID